MTTEDIRLGLARQRRSLLAISLVLLAFQYTGATVRQLTVAGNVIDLQRPLPLLFPLWIGWGYAMLRYYQYFRGLGVERGVASAFSNRMFELLKRKAEREFVRSYPRAWSGWPTSGDPKVKVDRLEPRTEDGNWVFAFTGKVNSFEPTLGRRVDIKGFEKVDFTLSSVQTMLSKGRAAFGVAVHTHLLTEHFLPFAVALSPVGMAAARALDLWRP